jgi:hypothetical protein
MEQEKDKENKKGIAKYRRITLPWGRAKSIRAGQTNTFGDPRFDMFRVWASVWASFGLP